MDDHPPSASHLQPDRRRLPLHTKILLGLVIGIFAGLVARTAFSTPVEPGINNPHDTNANGLDDRVDWFAQSVADPIGRVFLRLVFDGRIAAGGVGAGVRRC